MIINKFLYCLGLDCGSIIRYLLLLVSALGILVLVILLLSSYIFFNETNPYSETIFKQVLIFHILYIQLLNIKMQFIFQNFKASLYYIQIFSNYFNHYKYIYIKKI